MSGITKTRLEFVSQDTLPDIPVQILRENDYYGVFSFETEKNVRLNQKIVPHLFHIMIDISETMLEPISPINKHTKLDIVIHTIRDMLYYLANRHPNNYVIIKGFGSYIHTYVEKTEVTPKNVEKLLSCIKQNIHRASSADIGLVLNQLKLDVSNNAGPDQSVLFFTDGLGDINANPDVLLEQILPDVPSHYITVGYTHNSDLMYRLGHAHANTSNWFIDNEDQIENISNEILFNELNKCASDICITVTYGTIFDYNRGCFVKQLQLGGVTYDSKRHFHIVSNHMHDCSVILQSGTTQILSEKLLSVPTHIPMYITQQYLRLGVQYMQASALLNTNNANTCAIHKQQYELYLNMLKPVDLFMRVLISDIQILIKYVESESPDQVHTYLNARMDSHGLERTYGTVDEISLLLNTNNIEPPKLVRHDVDNNFDYFSSENADINS